VVPASPEPRPAIAPIRDVVAAAAPGAAPQPDRFAGRAMASPLVLQVHDCPVAAQPARGSPAPAALPASAEPSAPAALWGRVVAEFEAAEQALSRFRDGSALTELNRSAGDGSWHRVDARLYRTLAAAERAWRLTGGRFDPRVLRDLERLGYRGAPLDDGDGTTGTRPVALDPGHPGPLGHGPWLERDPRRAAVRLGVPLDSGGIGKGLALRWAWRAIEARLGERGALLEAGGDLIGRGPAPAGPAWLVGIEDPTGGPGPLAVVALARGALCTSSVALTHWRTDDGRAVHHLLDPRTGEPGGDGLLATTVAAADPAWAEVWSKALFLAGASSIGDEARARGLAVWWVEADGSLHLTPAARPRTVWTAS
jgi:FAD:protein FMN transferase